MKLSVYLAALVVSAFFASMLAMGLDYYGKRKNYNTVIRKRINYILIQSNYELKFSLRNDDRPISKQSYICQIVNIVIILLLLTVSIVGTVVHTNVLFDYICFIAIGIYCLANMVGSIVVYYMNK